MFTKYNNVALQFSGGKDSLACLYLMKAEVLSGKITVYWLNTGDNYPETLEVIEQVKLWVPKFVEVTSDVVTWREANGIPSDLVPVNGHQISQAYGISPIRISNRMDCCFSNIMKPLHDRMLFDKIDMVIRGTKKADTGTVPFKGPSIDYEIFLPIEGWSHKDVVTFLASVQAPYSKLYDFPWKVSAPECLGCTGWWSEGIGLFLRERHPEAYRKYKFNLYHIAQSIKEHHILLTNELERMEAVHA